MCVYRNEMDLLRSRMKENCELEWNVLALSFEVNLSPSRFAAVYKDLYNISPIDDLINSRLERASYLLRYSDYLIIDISVMCGFNSPYYFSRIFRRRMHMSPESYRLGYKFIQKKVR